MTFNRALALALSFGLPVAILLTGILAFVVMGALKPKPEKKDQINTGLPVFAESVTRTGVVLSVAAQGEVTPLHSADISAQVSGLAVYVSPKLVDGGFFEENDVLVGIEDSEYRLAVVSAQARVANARQRFAMAKAETEQAGRDWKRLGAGKASALALRLPQLEEARAALAAAEAGVEDAQLKLSRTKVRAPFRGRVVRKMAEIGQYIVPGTPLAAVFATDAVEVELLLSSRQMNDIGLSLAFDASSDVAAAPEVVLSADVGGRLGEWQAQAIRTGARINPSTRLISIFARVNDPFGSGRDGDMPLVPGMFVDALIAGRRIDEALSAPRAALRGNDLLYLAVPTDQGNHEIQLTRIHVVRSNVQRVYFLSDDLTVGSLVVTSPVTAPFDGMRIKIIDEGDSVAASPATLNGGG